MCAYTRAKFSKLIITLNMSYLDTCSLQLGRTVPVSQQIIAVLLSLIGTVVVSATVLYAFENPDTSMEVADAWLFSSRKSTATARMAARMCRESESSSVSEERTFEDALIYMVNIFAGRDPPWYPLNPQAKIASVLATTSGIIFIPFLVARSVELFMKSEDGANANVINPVQVSAAPGGSWENMRHSMISRQVQIGLVMSVLCSSCYVCHAFRWRAFSRFAASR